MRNFRGILLLTAAFILMFNGNIAIAKKSSEKAMFSKSNSNSKNGEMFSSKKTSSKKAYSKKSKNKSKNLAKKRRSKKPRKLTIGERLALVKKRYLAGIIKDKQMWQELTKIHSNGKGL